MNYQLKSLNALAQKYKDAISEVSDERNNGDGVWIHLKSPFFNTEMESNIIHEQNLTKCIAILKSCVNHPTTKEAYFAKFTKNPTIN